MILAGIITALPGFLLRLVGEGALEKVLAYKKDQANSAAEIEKARIGADIKALEYEQKRREVIRDLQLKEYQHPVLWWSKALIMAAVAVYVFARFTVKTWGLADYGIAVAQLDTWEAGVASVVLGYLFLRNDLNGLVEKVIAPKDKATKR